MLKQNLSIERNEKVSSWGSFKPDHFGVLLRLTIWKGARMLKACADQILVFRGQGGGTHMNRVQFLGFFQHFWFYKDNGSTLQPNTYTKYPHGFSNDPQSVQIPSYGKATSTRAVLKQNLSIYLGVLQTWPFWSPSAPYDMERGKDVKSMCWPNFGVLRARRRETYERSPVTRTFWTFLIL